jgi:hypothetical protein
MACAVYVREHANGAALVLIRLPFDADRVVV